MKTDKIVFHILVFSLLIGLLTSCVGAPADYSTDTYTMPEATEEDPFISVYVSVADRIPLLTRVKVKVTDTDGDDTFTICDALTCAHEQYFDGGRDGFDYGATEYGFFITKLFGVDNSSKFGYYLNNSPGKSLLDIINDGDCIYSFVYSDKLNYSDTFCYFAEDDINIQAGEYSFTMTACVYDEEQNTATTVVVGAEITVDGVKTGIFTDSEGKATVELTEGEHIISAISDTYIIVPPICTAKVNK